MQRDSERWEMLGKRREAVVVSRWLGGLLNAGRESLEVQYGVSDPGVLRFPPNEDWWSRGNQRTRSPGPGTIESTATKQGRARVENSWKKKWTSEIEK